ncbi:unnamed protein product [Polarella glacialis]|uniref:histidine kinase n=1 Tax=Polarella glacialis TaxID=89957 RepID=A0A813I9D1_POLGL|nr:unnamed protein product [Polarella glacialis]
MDGMNIFTSDDGSDDVPTHACLCPRSAWLCHFCSLLLVIACIYNLAFCGIAPRVHIVDPTIPPHCGMAVLLVLSAFFTEICFAVASRATKKFVHASCHEYMSNHGIGDVLLTMTEYTLKCITGIYLWHFKGGIMHASPSVYEGGSPRTVHFGRFVSWSISIPVILLLCNRMFLAPCGFKVILMRSLPGILCASIYPLAAFVMAITENVAARWVLFFLVLLSFASISMDQVFIALECKKVSLFHAKFGILAYQIISFAVIAIVFVLGRFGVISVFAEQVFYAYADAGMMLFLGAMFAMLRHFEDVQSINHWWDESMHAKNDFENLIREASVPTFAMDAAGCLTSWNEPMAKLTGMPVEEAIGQPFMQLLCPGGQNEEDFRTAWQSIIGASTPRATGVLELFVRCRSTASDKATLLVNLVPRLSKEGRLEAVVAIGQDISEISLLKAVEEKKNQLMGVVSHELRSPLHGMIGLTRMMAEKASAAGMVRQLNMVQGCAVRLLDLVTNVMELSEGQQMHEAKVKKGKVRLPVNWLDLAEEVVVMTTMAVDKANKPLVNPAVHILNNVSMLDQVPIVLGDPYKCTQLLYNLVTNACKFTKAGSVTIQAELSDDKSRMEIQVVDTGCGIHEAAQKRIFIPFDQGSSSDADSRSFQGIGLGLSVVKTIADLHEAQIRVESNVGQGSNFGVSFACEQECFPKKAASDAFLSHEVAQGQQMTVTSLEAALPPPRRRRRSQTLPGTRFLVLSVDDDQVNQELIKQECFPKKAASDAFLSHEVAQGQQMTVTSLEAALPPPRRRRRSQTLPGTRFLVLSVDDDQVNQELIKQECFPKKAASDAFLSHEVAQGQQMTVDEDQVNQELIKQECFPKKAASDAFLSHEVAQGQQMTVTSLEAALPPPRRRRRSQTLPGTRFLVLSVDDDQVNQELIKQALGPDYEIALCMDGQEALDYLRVRKDQHLGLPDVVLLDIEMRGLSGFDVCQEIRSSYESNSGKLPIIMVSALTPGAMAVESVARGTDFIAKPFDMGALQRKVKISMTIKNQIANGPQTPPEEPSTMAAASLRSQKGREGTALETRLHELESSKDAQLQASEKEKRALVAASKRDKDKLHQAELELTLLTRKLAIYSQIDKEKYIAVTSDSSADKESVLCATPLIGVASVPRRRKVGLALSRARTTL